MSWQQRGQYHTGDLEFVIILIMGFILFVFVTTVVVPYFDNDDYKHDDTIIRIDAPLVLLHNGTWMEMPCQWLHAIPYCKLDEEGLWRELKRDNITRYSEMTERYACPAPRPNMYATKQAALRNSGYKKQWWEFWKDDPQNAAWRQDDALKNEETHIHSRNWQITQPACTHNRIW